MSAFSRRGQVLPIAIMCLLVLAILVPLMVSYTQTEAKWAVKESQNTQALHLAEAGIEKGYLAISLSTLTWTNLQHGTAITNYNYDKVYSDIGAGGSYTIAITSGPSTQQATIISIGRDANKKEVRAIKAVYSNSPLGGVAIYSGKGVQIGGGVQVEWGGIVSPNSIDASSRTHPQFWSASGINTKDTDPNPPNCDSPNCCQWHAFQANLPPAPAIDLNFYASSAAASNCSGIASGAGASITGTGATASPANSCYYPGSVTFKKVSSSGQTIYVNGDLTVDASGIDIVGNLIVTGNINLPSGAWGNGNHTMHVPSDAWKQYCNDWSAYQAFDGGAPTAFPGLNASYAPTGLTKTSNKLAVYGLLYVGGNFNNNSGGGGNSDIYGAMYALGSSTETASSGVTFYFDADAAQNLQTTQIILSRASWQDIVVGWPSGLP